MKKPTTKEMLSAILACVDFTSGACRQTEMVGAVLPIEVINRAKAALGIAARPGGGEGK